MTKQDKMVLEEYGTVFPCCGNCKFIKQLGFKLHCEKFFQYRDYDSVKCGDYTLQQWIPDKLSYED